MNDEIKRAALSVQAVIACCAFMYICLAFGKPTSTIVPGTLQLSKHTWLKEAAGLLRDT